MKKDINIGRCLERNRYILVGTEIEIDQYRQVGAEKEIEKCKLIHKMILKDFKNKNMKKILQFNIQK